MSKGEDQAWADKVSVAATQMLDKTTTKADVMEVFKINRTVFDQLKLVSKTNYDELMVVFKDIKEKRQ